MEDGTVSIFGLVFGVAATTTDQKAVLIAGASGAVAAAVSMMAGSYLDAETGQDQVRVMARRIDAEMQKDKAEVLDGVTQRLQAAGLPPDQAATVGGFLCAQPSVLRSVAMALAEPRRGFAARPAGALAVDADRRFPRCRHSDPAVRLSRRAAGPRGVGHGHDAAVGRAGRRAGQDRRPPYGPHRDRDGVDRRRRRGRGRRHRRLDLTNLHSGERTWATAQLAVQLAFKGLARVAPGSPTSAA